MYLRYKAKYLRMKGGSSSITFSVDKQTIIDGQTYKKEDFSGRASIKFNYGENKFYTTLMVDANAVNTNQMKYFLHMLKINNDQNIIKYMKPTPPPGSGTHLYHIYVYEQDGLIDMGSENFPRANFDLDLFVKSHRLVEVGHFKYQVE